MGIAPTGVCEAPCQGNDRAGISKHVCPSLHHRRDIAHSDAPGRCADAAILIANPQHNDIVAVVAPGMLDGGCAAHPFSVRCLDDDARFRCLMIAKDPDGLVRVSRFHIAEVADQGHDLAFVHLDIGAGIHCRRHIAHVYQREMAACCTARLIDAQPVLGKVEPAVRVDMQFVTRGDDARSVAGQPVIRGGSRDMSGLKEHRACRRDAVAGAAEGCENLRCLAGAYHVHRPLKNKAGIFDQDPVGVGRRIVMKYRHDPADARKIRWPCLNALDRAGHTVHQHRTADAFGNRSHNQCHNDDDDRNQHASRTEGDYSEDDRDHPEKHRLFGIDVRITDDMVLEVLETAAVQHRVRIPVKTDIHGKIRVDIDAAKDGVDDGDFTLHADRPVNQPHRQAVEVDIPVVLAKALGQAVKPVVVERLGNLAVNGDCRKRDGKFPPRGNEAGDGTDIRSGPRVQRNEKGIRDHPHRYIRYVEFVVRCTRRPERDETPADQLGVEKVANRRLDLSFGRHWNFQIPHGMGNRRATVGQLCRDERVEIDQESKSCLVCGIVRAFNEAARHGGACRLDWIDGHRRLAQPRAVKTRQRFKGRRDDQPRFNPHRIRQRDQRRADGEHPQIHRNADAHRRRIGPACFDTIGRVRQIVKKLCMDVHSNDGEADILFGNHMRQEGFDRRHGPAVFVRTMHKF